MVVKTYRGLLADGAQEKIPLSTKDGSVGYRIVKFQVMSPQAGASAYEMESTFKIYKTEQSTIDALVEFTDNDLLGAAQLGSHSQIYLYPINTLIIFDREIFNQDIFITHKNLHADALGGNYYIELEQMKLDHTQNMSATLKAIRGSAVD